MKVTRKKAIIVLDYLTEARGICWIDDMDNFGLYKKENGKEEWATFQDILGAFGVTEEEIEKATN